MLESLELYIRIVCESLPTIKKVAACFAHRHRAACATCYCYVCDAPVAECSSWDAHCEATDVGPTAGVWKSQRCRNQRLGKLRWILRVPTTRACPFGFPEHFSIYVQIGRWQRDLQYSSIARRKRRRRPKRKVREQVYRLPARGRRRAAASNVTRWEFRRILRVGAAVCRMETCNSFSTIRAGFHAALQLVSKSKRPSIRVKKRTCRMET